MKSNRCKLGTGHYLEARVGKAGSNKGRVNDFYAGKKGRAHKFMHPH